MSTVSLMAERMTERALLVELCESLRKQNAELDELQEMHAAAECQLEHQMSKLVRIANHMTHMQREFERTEKLVKLCMTGESADETRTAIAIEVNRLKSEELPF